MSSHGRLCNTKGVVSRGSLDCSGYRRVDIFGKAFKVHRVVKIAFHGLPRSDEAWQVHHIDGNKGNNRLDNLEYVTPSENVCRSYSSPSRRDAGLAQSKPVLWRPVGSTSWRTIPSVAAAARQLGIDKGTLSVCCRKKSAAKGYEFRYQDVSELALPGEEWRPMVDPRSGAFVPGRMVSSSGRITSRTGLISRGYQTSSGYFSTSLVFNSSRWGTLVHRLVAFAFLGSPPSDGESCVNHKDLDKGNNAVENLEWVSQAQNLTHFYASATLGRGTAAKPVLSRPHGTIGWWRWHHSMTSAAHELALSRHSISSISRCVRGLQKQASGFEFQFAEAPEIVSSVPGEEWRAVDVLLLQRDKEIRHIQN